MIILNKVKLLLFFYRSQSYARVIHMNIKEIFL